MHISDVAKGIFAFLEYFLGITRPPLTKTPLTMFFQKNARCNFNPNSLYNLPETLIRIQNKKKIRLLNYLIIEISL